MRGLGELVRIFFKLGITAFGGPAAHIAMLEEEVVSKRKWMDRQYFLDLIGATNLIPGPNSTEMVMHVGLHRAGVAGMLVAGISFILPSAVLTGALGWFYVQFGSLPVIEPFLVGIKPVILIIILNAVLKLGKKALRHWTLGIIGIIVAGAALLGLNEIFAILSGGVAGMLAIMGVRALRQNQANSTLAIPLFWTFLKIGAILFGSGYVLVAYLEAELVEKLGWLTQQQLLDAIAAGQFTPGPVLTTATFVGYVVDGWQGAITATVGIFLPSFLFVRLLNPIIPRIRESAWAGAFLDAVNISAVGIMAAVLLTMGQNVLTDWRTVLIAVIAAIFQFWVKKPGAPWLVIGGAVMGYALSFF